MTERRVDESRWERVDENELNLSEETRIFDVPAAPVTTILFASFMSVECICVYLCEISSVFTKPTDHA
jgi:hypothetical protein